MEAEIGSRFTYSVSAASTLFGFIEFVQMLLRRSDKLSINPSELVDSILNLDEILTIAPAYVFTKKSGTCNATLRLKKVFDFMELSGSKSSDGMIDSGKQWYAEFLNSETGTAQFTTSNHNNNKELRLTTAVGGSTKELKVKTVRRIPAVASTLYTVDAWTEIQAAFSNIDTGGGIRVVVKEWANKTGGSALATNTIFSGITSVHDFTKRSGTFTSNASTAWLSVEISVYQAIGTGRLADVTLTPATTETATVPGIASFSQAS